MKYQKYLNFSIILIVLSILDVISTRYALVTFPQLAEGNPIMSLVTGSLVLFVLVKALGVLIIVNIYRRIREQSKTLASIGQAIIILLMLFVVGNNMVMIGSAVQFNSYSGTAGTIGNGYGYITNIDHPTRNYYTFTEPTSIFIAEPISYATGIDSNWWGNLVVKGDSNLIYGLVASDGHLYFVDSQGIKRKTTRDNTGGIVANSSSLNDLVIISGDAPTNLYEFDGIIYYISGTSLKSFNLVDFTVSTVYSGLSNGGYGGVGVTRIGGVISAVYSTCAVGGYSTPCTVYLANQTSSSNAIYSFTQAFGQSSGSIDTRANTVWISPTYFYVNTYSVTNSGNAYAREYIISRTNYANVSLNYLFSGSTYNSMSFLGGQSSVAMGKNSASTYSTATFYEVGVLNIGDTGESTDVAELTYTTKSINSLYANYYNSSKFSIQSKILFDSGFWILGSNYGIDSQNYRWQIHLVDPNGATVNAWDSGACTDSLFYGTCSLNINREYAAPAGGWMAGNWYAKLYEHKVGSSLVGAEVGNLALLTTSATWNVYNASVSANATGTIGDPTESISSPGNLQTIGQIDALVGLLGYGINGTSKLLFSLLIVAGLFIIGLFYTRDGNIGLALSTIPYVFFTYIGYIEKWIFIIYIIMLIIISKVFR